MSKHKSISFSPNSASSGILSIASDTIFEAIGHKIEHIVKKLDIKKGQKVLEVGCGWGGMAIEIAKQKNCEVTGISLSKNQIQYCKEKVKELGLDNQVKFELIDYREAKGQYDRIYSVGMFEHVLSLIHI